MIEVEFEKGLGVVKEYTYVWGNSAAGQNTSLYKTYVLKGYPKYPKEDTLWEMGSSKRFDTEWLNHKFLS